MRARWHALHGSLLREAQRRSFEEVFKTMSTDLDGVDNLDRLLARLHDPAGDPEVKNRWLRGLIKGSETEPVLVTAVLLALWPGLDAAHGRLLRFFRDRPEELAGEIIGRATLEVHRIDPGRVNRIAATVIRNVERDIRRALFRTPAADPLADVAERAFVTAPASTLCRDLSATLGRDAPLIAAVAIGGASQRDAANDLGLSHDAARKRYQRARARLRAAWFG